ncbi:glycoside hydrolase family 75 protein [Schizothecium vesticola]|uniref:Endo-chitosanase n=1 Tax=Schizothecium vesticola TaxID=314040 RepID=A0AA40K4L7_9PEZI|nr:glycoside hydrolase family 75 protein [Schizothecium vesticola]
MHVMLFKVLLLVATIVSLVTARDVPENLRALYQSVRARGTCSNKLADGFFATDTGPGNFCYCGDHLKSDGIIYIQGQRGALADMDIDCDGALGGPADDGRCSPARSGDFQGQTSFRDTVQSYGIPDLNTYVHPYVVFGNSGRRGWNTFSPSKHGIRPLSIVAVVCGDKLVYGIWGDTNGDDGPRAMVGEAAISLATECYGRKMAGDNGHSDTDVLYIAFTGDDAVPGAHGANWKANSFAEFEASITGLGDSLVAGLTADSGAEKVCGWGWT